MLVDSHCHLTFPELQENLESIIEKAQSQGVQAFLTVNTRLEDALTLQEIAEKYPPIFCTVGVHPHETSSEHLQDLGEKLLTLSQHPKVVGIGETGLDYFYNHSLRECQIASFEQHLDSSIHLNLPLIIHTRDAGEDTLACIKNSPSTAKGVFHCFNESKDFARKALDLGFYLSFSGILTFKKAHELRDIGKFVPLDRILVETDSPFLAPIPHRGQRNEPAFVVHIAEMLAELREIPFSEIAKQTTANFFSLFQKAKPPSCVL